MEIDRNKLYNRIVNELFLPSKGARMGARTYLNVDCLWDTFWYIKEFVLTDLERACVVDYKVQTLLIELFQLKKRYNSVDQFINSVLKVLRSETFYWMESSDIYHQIESQSQVVPIKGAIIPKDHNSSSEAVLVVKPKFSDLEPKKGSNTVEINLKSSQKNAGEICLQKLNSEPVEDRADRLEQLGHHVEGENQEKGGLNGQKQPPEKEVREEVDEQRNDYPGSPEAGNEAKGSFDANQNLDHNEAIKNYLRYLNNEKSTQLTESEFKNNHTYDQAISTFYQHLYGTKKSPEIHSPHPTNKKANLAKNEEKVAKNSKTFIERKNKSFKDGAEGPVRNGLKSIDYICKHLIRRRKLKQGAMGGSRGHISSGTIRYTRNMKKIKLDTNSASISFLYQNGMKKVLENDLNIDLGFTKRLDYKTSIFVNPHYFLYVKISYEVIAIVYRYLIQKYFKNYYNYKNSKIVKNSDFQGREGSHLGKRALEDVIDPKEELKLEGFGLKLQNFLMWLNLTNEPIEKHGGRNKLIPKKYRGKFEDWLSEYHHTHQNCSEMLKLHHFALTNEDSDLSLKLSKIEAIRIKQVIFLTNLVNLGHVYIQTYQSGNDLAKMLKNARKLLNTGFEDKDPTQRVVVGENGVDVGEFAQKLDLEIQKDDLSAERIKNSLKMKLEAKREKGANFETKFSTAELMFFLCNLELFSNPCQTIFKQSVNLWVKIHDNQLLANRSSSEMLKIYSTLQTTKQRALRQPKNQTLLQIDKVHDNTYKDSESNARALEKYLDYVKNPETKKKQWYKFYREDGLNWPEPYFKLFLEGYLKFKKNPVNNAKIAQFITNSGKSGSRGGERSGKAVDGGKRVAVPVSANHVKYLKQKYLRLLKKRAKKNFRTVDDQIEDDIKNFEFKRIFPWLVNPAPGDQG